VIPHRLAILIVLSGAAAPSIAQPTPDPGKDFGEFRTEWNTWVDSVPSSERISDAIQVTLEAFSHERFLEISKRTKHFPSGTLHDARPWNEYWQDAIILHEEFADELETFHELAQRPHLGAAIESPETLAPIDQFSNRATDHISPLRHAAVYLISSAMFQATIGNTDAAVDRFQSASNLANHALELTDAITWLSQLAMRDFIAESILELVSYDPDLFSDTQLAKLQSIVLEQLNDDPARVFRAEHAITVWQLRAQFASDDPQSIAREYREQAQSIHQSFTSPHTINQSPSDLDDRTPLAPIGDQIRIHAELTNAICADLDSDPASTGALRLSNAIASNLAPDTIAAYIPVYTLTYIWRVQIGLAFKSHYNTINTTAALAIYRHRARHGSFPESLQALDPESLPIPPIDLYSGEPLRYTLVNGKPRLWALGADRDDDGGARPTSHDTSHLLSPKIDTWLSLDEWEELTEDERQLLNADIRILD